MNDALRPYLGFSFRWLPARPDERPVFDAVGNAQCGIYLSNHGLTPARDVQFCGALLVGAGIAPVSDEQLRAIEQLENPEHFHPRPCYPAKHGGLPLYYVLTCDDGPIGNRLLHAVGLATYKDTLGQKFESRFHALWTVDGWMVNDEGNAAT